MVIHPRAAIAVSLCSTIMLSVALRLPADQAKETAAPIPDSTQGELRRVAREQGGLFIAPESPAFTFLGLSPAMVTRPTSAKGLALTLANAVDSAGRVVQGFAIEFVPPFLKTAFRTDLARYQQSALTRALANTRISLGSAKVGGDSASTDLGLGLSVLFVDRGDPMGDAAFTRRLSEVLSQSLPETPPPADSEIPPEVRASVQELRSEWKTAHWNSRRTLFSAVTGLRFLRSEFGDSRGLGGSAWLVHSEPMRTWGQFLLHLQYDHRRELPATPKQQRLVYGTRANLGSPGYNSFLELSGSSDLTHGGDPQGRWTAGVEFRIADGVWVSTGLGSGFGPARSGDHVIVIANLRWAIADAARWSPR